jgi:hypothetical protein
VLQARSQTHNSQTNRKEHCMNQMAVHDQKMFLAITNIPGDWMSATLITTLCNARAVPCSGETSWGEGVRGGHGWVHFGQSILIPKTRNIRLSRCADATLHF